MKKEVLATFLVTCPDRTGIIARVASFFHMHEINIINSQNYSEENMFFMRIVGDISHLQQERSTIEQAFAPLAQQLQGTWKVYYSDQKERVSIFVSHEDACLHELLNLYKRGELPCEIVCIVSNHSHLQPVADFYSVPFYVFPVTPSQRREQEQQIEKILDQYQVDLIILARYMQILSPDFCQGRLGKIINIHHGFLPAFQGAKPYHQAFSRGVKIIGATAHYVTAELDQGPIIEQDVIRVDHCHSVREFIQLGRDVERRVLTRAVRLHLDHRIIIYQQRTIIF